MSSSLYVAPSHTSSMAHKQVFMQPCSCCPIQVFPNSRLVEGVWGINCLESNPHFSRKTDPAEEGLRHPRRNLSETIGLSSDRSALRTACRRGRPRVDHVPHRWDSAVQACQIETTGYVSLLMYPREPSSDDPEVVEEIPLRSDGRKAMPFAPFLCGCRSHTCVL